MNRQKGLLFTAPSCYALATRVRFDAPPGGVAVIVLVFGSQFPDLLDKPLAWYLGVLPTGRTLGHSLLLLVPLSIALYVVARRYGRAEYGVAFAIGALSHTFVDGLPILWDPEETGAHLLWPITPVEPYESGAPSVLELFFESLADPYFLSEFALATIAFVYWRRHGYPGLEVLWNLRKRIPPVADRS